tara:strand:- start:7392 stop:7658 length:267 start_codon:yes stop_codon:yes gene_type:complete
MQGDLTKISGLWANKDKNGNEYFTGGVGGVSGKDTFTLTADHNILIFKNAYKQKENDPDYNLFIAPKKEKEGGSSPSGAKNLEADIPY